MKTEPQIPCCETCVFSTLRDDALWCRYSLYLPTRPEDSCDKHQAETQRSERNAQKPVQNFDV